MRPHRAANPMRPAGRRLSEAVAADLLADWTAHGRQTIERVRRWMPHRYLALVAAFARTAPAPAPEDDIAAMSDEEVARELEKVLAEIAALEGR